MPCAFHWTISNRPASTSSVMASKHANISSRLSSSTSTGSILQNARQSEFAIATMRVSRQSSAPCLARSPCSSKTPVLRQQTKQPIKWALPGPMTMIDTLFDGHYKSREKLAREFAVILNEEAKELRLPASISSSSTNLPSTFSLTM